jgi:hypothetical protein
MRTERSGRFMKHCAVNPKPDRPDLASYQFASPNAIRHLWSVAS